MSRRNGKSNGSIQPVTLHARVVAQNVGLARLPVLKTYKIFVGGKFPRSESGRYSVLNDSRGKAIANICDCSKKDFRDAAVAARAAQSSWASTSAYNRAQILYRIAEMLEGRSRQFIDELTQTGLSSSVASKEVELSIDRLVYYAGWADKYQQIFSSVNPVSSSHFNFSLLEPMGVVSILAAQEFGLLGLISVIAPAICGGNTCIALASSTHPLAAMTFAEVLATSDLPGGVVNLLTGKRSELIEVFAGHLDVNACVGCGLEAQERTKLQSLAADGVKRVALYDQIDWTHEAAQSPYHIMETQEVKTTWHPIGT